MPDLKESDLRADYFFLMYVQVYRMFILRPYFPCYNSRENSAGYGAESGRRGL